MYFECIARTANLTRGEFIVLVYMISNFDIYSNLSFLPIDHVDCSPNTALLLFQ